MLLHITLCIFFYFFHSCIYKYIYIYILYIYIYIYILLQHFNAVCNQNRIDRWRKGCILHFPRISQELPTYNPYIHDSQGLQWSTTQLHRTENWENTWEEPKWLSEKSIHDITNFDYPSNSRSWIILAYGLPKEIVAAIMMLYKNTKVSGRSHRLLWHCSKCATRRTH